MGKQRKTTYTEVIPQSYDDYFKSHQSLKYLNEIEKKYGDAFTDGSISEWNVDSRNRDYIEDTDVPINTRNFKVGEADPWIDIRANRQGPLEDIGEGIGRFGVKVAAEVLKVPGVIGGIAAGAIGQTYDMFADGDQVDFMTTAFNNPWIQTINNWNEEINDEFLPVYTRTAVRDGNLLDKIFSTEFWATDGADGIAYMAAMMAPGMAVSKLGLGAKASEFLSKVGVAEKTLQNAGFIGNAANVKTAAAFNSIFEAGSEASSLQQRMEKYLEDQYVSGEITEAQYEQRRKEIPAYAAKSFKINAVLLMPVNYMMAKAMHGVKGVSKVQQQAIKDGQLTLENIVKPKGSDRILNSLGRLTEGTFTEGFVEEGTQTATEQMLFNKFTNKNYDKNLLEAYSEMLGTSEGQTSIFLGAMLGGPMMSYQGRKEDVAGVKRTNQLINHINTKGIEAFSDVTKLDIFKTKLEDGKVVFDLDPKTGNPQLDGVKFLEKFVGLQGIMDDNLLYQKAISEGDNETLDFLQKKAMLGMAMNFIHDEEMGSEFLKEYLERSGILDPVTQVSEDPKKTKRELIETATKMADNLRSHHEIFEGFKGLVTPKNENATPEDFKKFEQKLYNSYMNNAIHQILIEGELASLKTKKDNYFKKFNPLYSTTDLEGTNALLKQDLMKDERLSYLVEEEGKLNNLLEELRTKEKAFFKNKDVDENFKDFLEFNKKLNEETSPEKVNEADDIITKINNAENKEELDIIGKTIPDNSSLKQKLQDKYKEIEAFEKLDTELKNEDILAKNELTEKEIDSLLEFYSVGDKAAITPSITNDKSLIGREATITKIDKVKKTVNFHIKKDDGTYVTITKSALDLKDATELSFSSEGGDISTPETTTVADVAVPKFTTGGTKVISTDDKGDSLEFMKNNPEFAGFLEFERNPNVVKKGQVVRFEINQNPGKNENILKALEMFKNKDFSDVEFLVKYLPINVVFEGGQKAPLHTYYEVNKKESENFKNTGRRLRNTLIQELASGTKLESLSTVVEGQYNGTLQLEDEVVENKVHNLQKFNGDVSKVKPTDIYMVNEKGILVNTSDKNNIFPTKRLLAPGEIYIKIQTAAGIDFPLKLNVAKISPKKADILYDLYKYRFHDIKERNKFISLKEIDDTNLVEKIKNILAREIKIIGKNPKDILIKDLIDFLIWDGTSNKKSRVRFTSIKGEPRLIVMDKLYNINEFENSREEFIQKLSNENESGKAKRQHIIYKSKKGEISLRGININNRKYLNYLLEEGILNTNAKTAPGEYTFQGNTSIYLKSDGVKVNNEFSKFNTTVAPVVENKIENKATNGELESLLPEFDKGLTLTSNEEFYVDKEGKNYERVSKLKPEYTGPSDSKANARGDVIDEMFREVLSKTHTMTFEQFKTIFEKVINNVNQKRGLVESKPVIDFSKVFVNEKATTIKNKDGLYMLYFKQGTLILVKSEEKITEKETVDKKGNVITPQKSTIVPLKNADNKFTTIQKIEEVEKLILEDKDPELIKNFRAYKEQKLNNLQTSKGTPLVFREEAIRELYDITNYYSEYFKSQNWKIYPNTKPIGGIIGKEGKQQGRYAGSMDILAYDTVNKEWIIIDIKSSTADRYEGYGTEKDKSNYAGNDKIQLNAYAELFNQTTGKSISKIFILPITTNKESTSSFNVISLKKSEALNKENKNLIPVDNSKNIYEILEVQKVEPVKSVKSPVVKQSTVEQKNTLSKTTKSKPKETLLEGGEGMSRAELEAAGIKGANLSLFDDVIENKPSKIRKSENNSVSLQKNKEVNDILLSNNEPMPSGIQHANLDIFGDMNIPSSSTAKEVKSEVKKEKINLPSKPKIVNTQVEVKEGVKDYKKLIQELLTNPENKKYSKQFRSIMSNVVYKGNLEAQYTEMAKIVYDSLEGQDNINDQKDCK